jgi:outer membrane protein
MSLLSIRALVTGREFSWKLWSAARAETVSGVVRSTRRKLLMTTTFVVAMTGQAAQAAEPAPSSNGFYVNLGVAGLLFDADASINAAGRPLPGSNLHASNNVTLGFGVGYFLTPDVSLLALLGVPPETTLTGRGTLSGLTLGKVTYGPSI